MDTGASHFPATGGHRDGALSHLDIAVGCTGGKHRSVVIASELAKRLKDKGYAVELSNRELRKSR